jgi:hypothetical protein
MSGTMSGKQKRAGIISYQFTNLVPRLPYFHERGECILLKELGKFPQILFVHFLDLLSR